jgi:nitrate reductase NapE component
MLTLLYLLVYLAVLGFALWILRMIIGAIGVPEPWGTIFIAIIALLFLIWLLSALFGILPGSAPLRFPR